MLRLLFIEDTEESISGGEVSPVPTRDLFTSQKCVVMF
jgi:hypothetical protein